MMFAIRDDDTSFWTNYQDLEEIYDPFWKKGIRVSLAVIPFAVQSHFQGEHKFFYQDEENKSLEENSALVDFLREKNQQNKIEIMLHGYSHAYQVRLSHHKSVLATKTNTDGLRKRTHESHLQWIGEYAWKTEDQLMKETQEGKAYLEKLFSTEIRIFVPPSNHLSMAGAKAMMRAGLHLSGIMGIFPERPLTWAYLLAYIQRGWSSVRYHRPYPYPLSFNRHQELVAYPLTPRVSLETLIQQFLWCEKKNAPFVLATHYWELKKYPDLRGILKSFIDFVSKRETSFVPLSHLFN